MNIEEKYAIVDIETATQGDKPDAEVDLLRYVGIKSCTGVYRIYHYTQKEEIQKALRFPYIVTHNGNLYDIPVLNRCGIYVPRSTIHIDTYDIAVNRMKSMMYIDTSPGDLSLKNLLIRFSKEVRKGEFDYALLQKEVLEGQEYEDMASYLRSDLDGAEELFKYFYELFFGFREYMNDENKRRMSWLTCRAGSTAYKCICNIADLKEEYADISDDEAEDSTYEGAYVSLPYVDFVRG